MKKHPRTLAGLLAGVLVGGVTAVSFVPGAEARPGTTGYGLTGDGALVSFSTKNPRGADRVGKITGLRQSDRLVGIDIRPANDRLYGVGRQGGIYTVNLRTARATRVGQLGAPLSGRHFGVDVNPAADALRIVSANGQNLRYSFADRTTTRDTPLNVPDVDSRVSGVVAAGYTNNDTTDVTGTALYDVSAATDSLLLQVPANGGTLTEQGRLGRGVGARTGFDIHTDIRNGRAVGNTGYATIGNAKRSALYQVDLTSGRSILVGRFPGLVVDLAVVSG